MTIFETIKAQNPHLFAQWLQTAEAEQSGDTLVITVPSDAARLALGHPNAIRSLDRAARFTYGRPLALRFVVDTPPASPEPAPLVEPLTAAAAFDPADLLAGAEFDPARMGGFSILSHYATYFWGPLLGPAFDLWLRLAADKRIPHAKGDNYIKQPEVRWSPPLRYTFSEMARMVDKVHPRVIKGGEVECWQTLKSRETGEPRLSCCGAYDLVRPQLGLDDCVRCMHWQTGLLQLLHAEKLVAVREQPGQRRAHRLEVQVWRYLHLLTPAQVARLNVPLQDEHERWLTGGSDRPNLAAALGIDPEEWAKIEAPTLIDQLPGWAEGRRLTADFSPDAEFLLHACHKNAGDHFF